MDNNVDSNDCKKCIMARNSTNYNSWKVQTLLNVQLMIANDCKESRLFLYTDSIGRYWQSALWSANSTDSEGKLYSDLI